VEENLDLFRRMRAVNFPTARVCSGKDRHGITNMNLRDPVMYRILHATHAHTGDDWCIYPMYDYAHGQSDSIEGITHSICTLEFEDHRPLYDWFIEQLGICHPQQIEFARLNLTYTVMSKRKLLELVREGLVSGWDDPRMPTLVGMRRRGYTPESIRNFCERIGVGKNDSWIDMSNLEESVREDLNERAPRVMGVLRPLRMVIENCPEDLVEEFDLQILPTGRRWAAARSLFTRWSASKGRFHGGPAKGYFRLAPGREFDALCVCGQMRRRG
jgi:glutaminyl-tRNA synthetase